MTRWRYWRLTRWLVSRAYVLGVISGSMWSSDPPTQGYIARIFFRGDRPYILGLERRQWGVPWHLIRYRHRPEFVWSDICGKCAPWPCCGATGFDHAADCEYSNQERNPSDA